MIRYGIIMEEERTTQQQQNNNENILLVPLEEIIGRIQNTTTQ